MNWWAITGRRLRRLSLGKSLDEDEFAVSRFCSAQWKLSRPQWRLSRPQGRLLRLQRRLSRLQLRLSHLQWRLSCLRYGGSHPGNGEDEFGGSAARLWGYLPEHRF